MRYQEDPGPPMFTYAALATFLAFFGADYSGANLTAFIAYPWRVADHELWRLVTCTFMHAGLLHLAFNAAMFFRFSRVVDDWLGPWGAMGLYVMFALSSNAVQLLIERRVVVVVGASGVVYGLFGFLWVVSRRRDDAAEAAPPQVVQTMFIWIGICALVNYFGGSIANAAHVWGLLIGWLVGQCVVARRKWRAAVIVGTVVVWALPIVLAQRPVWKRTLAHVPIVRSWYPHDIPPAAREAIERERAER